MLSANPILMPQKTIYFSLGMQMYMTETIKKPIIQGISVLFHPQASKLDKVKAVRALWKVLEALKGLPEPTKENTWHPNTHNLIDLRDSLFGHCFLGGNRMELIRRIINFVIILYDFDPPWRWIFDSLREGALQMKWKPRGFQDTWVDSYRWWKE